MPQIHDVNIQCIQPLAAPKEYLEKLPATPQTAQLVAEGRQQIARILAGEDQRMLLVVGPCSLHDVQAGYEYATPARSGDDRSDHRLAVRCDSRIRHSASPSAPSCCIRPYRSKISQASTMRPSTNRSITIPDHETRR